MKNQEPLVTIITVVFNGAKTLEQAINSVINQSYQYIEYIIIDGGSTDGSVEIIKKHENRVAYWVSERDNGIYDAMNKGLRHASGSLIGILNSDDWYEPCAVAKIVQQSAIQPHGDVYHGLLKVIAQDGKAESIVGHFNSFLDRGMIEHPTCFVRKDLYSRIGFFDSKFRSAADYDWMLRARAEAARFVFIPEVLTNFRLGGISDSHVGYIEELSIKRQYKLISATRFLFRLLYIKFAAIVKRFIL